MEVFLEVEHFFAPTEKECTNLPNTTLCKPIHTGLYLARFYQEIYSYPYYNISIDGNPDRLSPFTMSGMLPIAVYGQKVPAGDVMIPAIVDFPATVRLQLFRV